MYILEVCMSVCVFVCMNACVSFAFAVLATKNNRYVIIVTDQLLSTMLYFYDIGKLSNWLIN